jgi:hypothetical protein
MPRKRIFRLLVLAAIFIAPALHFSYKAWKVGLLDGLPGVGGEEISREADSGSAVPCRECHDAVGELHHRGPHRGLLCEDCHGLQAKHRADGTIPPDGVATSSVVRLCSQCHRDSEGGAGPPRINLEAHVIEVGALFSDTVCFDCHRPHDPRP